MTWIRIRTPDQDPAIAGTLETISSLYPPEYSQASRASRNTPPLVRDDSIMVAHSLIPTAMEHIFRGYAAMLESGFASQSTAAGDDRHHGGGAQPVLLLNGVPRRVSASRESR